MEASHTPSQGNNSSVQELLPELIQSHQPQVPVRIRLAMHSLQTRYGTLKLVTSDFPIQRGTIVCHVGRCGAHLFQCSRFTYVANKFSCTNTYAATRF